MDKDKDDPQLRDVLAQRPEGGSRGRRRRVGRAVLSSTTSTNNGIRSRPANDPLRTSARLAAAGLAAIDPTYYTRLFTCFLSFFISRTISAEGFTGWVGAERQAGVPGCIWASTTTGLSLARLDHRNGSGGVCGLTLLSLHHYRC